MFLHMWGHMYVRVQMEIRRELSGVGSLSTIWVLEIKWKSSDVLASLGTKTSLAPKMEKDQLNTQCVATVPPSSCTLQLYKISVCVSVHSVPPPHSSACRPLTK